MKPSITARVIPGIAVVLCAFMLAYWFSSDRRADKVVERVPGQDQQGSSAHPNAGSSTRPAANAPTSAGPASTAGGTTTAAQPTSKVGQTVASGAAVQALPGEWPRFRGANLTNIDTETVPLATKWQSGAPPLFWGMDVGEGHAGAAVWNSRVYLLDYDRQAQADVLRCLALADGKEIWHYAYPCSLKRNHGMSRTVPAVTSKYVVTLGPKCNVVCAEPLSGKVYWTMDLTKDYRTEVPPWYAGQCPLIDGDRAIIAPGGTSLMIAVDCASGKVVWRAPNPNGWTMTHSSVVPMNFQGRRMYIYCGSGGVAGVSAKDGSILWQTTDWTVKIANVPTPVAIGDDRVFLCGGYNSGSMMLQLKSQGGGITTQTVFKLPPTTFGSDQQTPVFYKGYIYGVIPGGQMTCLDLNGRQKWTSGSTYRFGIGPYMIADGKILALDDSGLLTIADASPAGFHPLAQARILNGSDAWGPMALAGGRLIARDLTRMVCVDMTKR